MRMVRRISDLTGGPELWDSYWNLANYIAATFELN
jgi:hypothetical protein